MANTTWNPADKGAGVTLTGGNLIASATVQNQGVRAVDKQTTGKFYFELTITAGATFQAIHGMGNATASLSSVANSPTNAVGILGNTGTIFNNGSNAGISFGTLANGNIIGIAVDLTSNQIWFRLAPSGNWNANASYAPGGTGGVSISTIKSAGLFPLFAIASTVPTTDSANFGDSAFSGAVPGGFTAGFPAGSGGGSAQARAMVLA
jgi:hypothetical protein